MPYLSMRPAQLPPLSTDDRFRRRFVMVVIAMGLLGTLVGWYILGAGGRLSPVLLAVQATATTVLSGLLLAAWSRVLPQRVIEMACLAFAVVVFVVCMALRMYSPRYGATINLQPLYLWFPALYVFAFTLTDHRTGLVISLGILLLFVGVSLPYLVRNIDAQYANFTLQLHVASAALIATLYFFSRYQHRLRLAQVTVEQLASLSNTDELTKLANRRYLAMAISMELARPEAHGRGLALLLFDIDHFKAINDRFGHGVGDQALIALAGRAAEVLRGTDTLGRWGGDEFVALVRDIGVEDAMRMADALCTRVASKPLPGGEFITVSCGVALARAGDSVDSLVRRADTALYTAKYSGRNRAESVLEPLVPSAQAALGATAA